MDSTVICERCRKAVPVTSVKYVQKGPDSKIILCTDCRAKNPSFADSIKDAAKKQSSKQSYLCTRCKYQFKFSVSSQSTLKCPYCGKDDRLSEMQPLSADQLLNLDTDGE